MSTGAPGTYRLSATATRLSDGRVLIAGGKNGSLTPLSTAEIYTPASGTFTPTGSMATARSGHVATLLSSGKVLVVGGFNGTYLKSAELFDPTTGSWSTAGNMVVQRAGHALTALTDGRVLVVGGYNATDSALASTELYSPASNLWNAGPSMSLARRAPSAVRLSNGKVLVAGGWNAALSSLTELLDPTTNRWQTTGSLATGRLSAAMIDLGTGKVLVAGGYALTSPCCGSSLASAELYDVATSQWSVTASLSTPRASARAILSNGNALFLGGDNMGPIGSVERYTPASGTWTLAPALLASRFEPGVALLTNGKTLVTGEGTAELYDDSNACTPTTCVAQGKNCGALPDGCGGTLQCGTCTSGSCVNNVCSTGCAHSVCSSGSALVQTCSTCATAVCSHDSFCCTSSWDSVCVSEVKTYCAAGTCP